MIGASTPTAGALDGVWNGITEQGKAMSFTVLNSKITAVSFSGTATGITGCTVNSTVTTTGISVAITNNNFALNSVAGPGGVSYIMEGRFSSSSQSLGTIVFTPQPIPGVTNCSATQTVVWSASK